MWNKKLSVLFLLVLTLAVPGFTAEKTDMVVLLDNSVSVLPIYDDLEHNLIRGILETHLSEGDRFHLISFADTPEVEISREIRSREQVDDILKYVTILQPMGQYTDLLLAMMFLDTYVQDLSIMSRKKILILTDGVHDPPPDSPFYGLSESQVEERMADFSRELRKKGWDFHILSLDGNIAREQSKPSYLDSLTEHLGVSPAEYTGDEGSTLSHVALGIPQIVFPETLGEVDRHPVLPLQIRNFAAETRLITITGVLSKGRNLLRREESITLDKSEEATLKLKLELPEDIEPGELSLDLTLVTRDDDMASPLKGTVGMVLAEGGFNRRTGRIVLILAAVLAGTVVVFVVVRFFSSGFSGSHGTAAVPSGSASGQGAGYTPERHKGWTGGGAAAPSGRGSRPSAEPGSFKPGRSTSGRQPAIKGSRPLELLVGGQRRFPGGFNIIDVAEGSPVSLGGRGSGGFTIFIAPFPDRIATIEKKKDGYSLQIIDEASFPDRRGTIRDCSNRDITLVDRHGREVIIRFQEWISPLERINRILHLTDNPGLPDFDY